MTATNDGDDQLMSDVPLDPASAANDSNRAMSDGRAQEPSLAMADLAKKITNIDRDQKAENLQAHRERQESRES